MRDSRLYVEGGGDSNALAIRCREGFKKLLENGGLKGRLPRIVPCGARNDAYDSFLTTQKAGGQGYVGLLVDSEDVVADIEMPWEHLKKRDGWSRPSGTREEQALLMTTCMETWIIADRSTLKKHYGARFQESALPSIINLEMRHRHEVQDALVKATRNCTNAYEKNQRSFEILGKLKPEALQQLPSFCRAMRILEQEL